MDKLFDKNYAYPGNLQIGALAQAEMLNEAIFVALDNGTADSIVRSRVQKYRDTKDGREAFLDLDAYQKGQGCEETCATTAIERLHAMRLTPNYPGGSETFLAKWDEYIEELREIQHAPDEFYERTHLKQAIIDPDYKVVLSQLDLMEPPPSVSTIKREIRRAGAKLERSRQNTALRRTRMAR